MAKVGIRELEDFRNVLWIVWNHLGLPDPTPVQYDIAHWLQWGPRRQVTEAFRGVGKSWVTSAFVVDALRHIPSLNILVVSAAKPRADDFSTFTQRLIREVPLFQGLVPREDQRDSKIAFDVGPAPPAHAPSVKSVGILGQITGSRADIIIADDVEVWNNSATQVMREKLAEVVREFDAVLKPVPTDAEIESRAPGVPLELARQYFGRVIYLGTPQTEQSLYNCLPERGYTTRIWPARYPPESVRIAYEGRLAPTIEQHLSDDPSLTGKPTDPRRFGELELQEREASYGRSGFALQFMLDTSLSDANRYPLKISDLMVMDLDVEVGPEKVVWASGIEQVINDLPNVAFGGDRWHRPMAILGNLIPWKGSVMAVDPSGRGKDETAFAVVNNMSSQLFAVDAGGYTGGYTPEVLEQLALRAKEWKVKRILVEENFGDGMFAALLKPVLGKIYPCTVEEVKHSVQKEKRIIDTLEPVMNQHRLIINRRLVENDWRTGADVGREVTLRYQLFYQMTRITRERGALLQDDRLDALAIAVAYWVNQMSVSVDKAMEDRRNALMEDELKKFREHVFRIDTPQEPTWIDSLNGLFGTANRVLTRPLL